MPVLVPNRPIEQRSPVLLVENRFEPGVHRFALVVVDDSGSESEADVIAVTVRRAIVVEPVRPPVVGPVRPPIDDTRIDVPVRPPVRRGQSGGQSGGGQPGGTAARRPAQRKETWP